MRNFSIRLKLQLSTSLNLPSSKIAIVSSSSTVNVMFFKLSITSSVVVITEGFDRKDNHSNSLEDRLNPKGDP